MNDEKTRYGVSLEESRKVSILISEVLAKNKIPILTALASLENIVEGLRHLIKEVRKNDHSDNDN